MNQPEERTAVIERQLEAAAAGVGPGARLVQDDGAVLLLGGLQPQASENASVRENVAHAGMDDRVVAAEPERGGRSLVHQHRPVLQLRRHGRDAVRRRLAVDRVEREVGDRRRTADVVPATRRSAGARLSGSGRPANSCAVSSQALNAGRADRETASSLASAAAMRAVSRSCCVSFSGGHSSSDGRGVALVKCE